MLHDVLHEAKVDGGCLMASRTGDDEGHQVRLRGSCRPSGVQSYRTLNGRQDQEQHLRQRIVLVQSIAGSQAHLGYGRANARTEVIILIHGLNATTTTHTGEVIAEHHLNPTKSYQPKN